MDVKEFTYKSDKEAGRNKKYIGAMAQDFHKTFDFGDDCDKLSIDTLQADGVLLSAIKGLIDKVEQLENKIEVLENEKSGFDEEKLKTAVVDQQNSDLFYDATT